MHTEMALTARRFALTLAVAGIAGLGSIAVAPAASASLTVPPIGSTSVVPTGSGSGPDVFIVLENGVRPIFFCDPLTPMQRHNTCTPPVTSGVRFR